MFLIYLFFHSICIPGFNGLDESLLVAAENRNKQEVTMFMNHPEAANISGDYLGQALSWAAKNGNEIMLSSILRHPKFADISGQHLGRALLWAAEYGREEIVASILRHRNSADISSYDLGKALLGAAMFFSPQYTLLPGSGYGHEKIVFMILQHPNSADIPGDSLGQALSWATRSDYSKIVASILRHRNSADIPGKYLDEALLNVVFSGNEEIIKLLFQNSKVEKISAQVLNKALKIATERKLTESTNWLKAYTALKPEAELIKLNYRDQQFYDAYMEFLDGKPQVLRNLVFPVGKKVARDEDGNVTTSNIYAISPLPGKETQVLKMISSSLVKLFKVDHIKPLLLSLVETNFQKKAALDILRSMELLKQPDGSSAKSQPKTSPDNDTDSITARAALASATHVPGDDDAYTNLPKQKEADLPRDRQMYTSLPNQENLDVSALEDTSLSGSLVPSAVPSTATSRANSPILDDGAAPAAAAGPDASVEPDDDAAPAASARPDASSSKIVTSLKKRMEGKELTPEQQKDKRKADKLFDELVTLKNEAFNTKDSATRADKEKAFTDKFNEVGSELLVYNDFTSIWPNKNRKLLDSSHLTHYDSEFWKLFDSSKPKKP